MLSGEISSASVTSLLITAVTLRLSSSFDVPASKHSCFEKFLRRKESLTATIAVQRKSEIALVSRRDK